MTKQELINLSNSTFTTNGQGIISAASHRAFNEALIGTLFPDWQSLSVVSFEKLETPPVGLAYKDYGDFVFLKGGIQPTIEGTRHVKITVLENFSEQYIGIFNENGSLGETFSITIMGNDIIIIILNPEFTLYDDGFNFSVVLTKNVDNW